MFIDPYRWQSVRITSIIHECLDAVTLVTERPDEYIFSPGQHAIMRVTLTDGSQRLRQYSFAHAPRDKNLYFTITRSPGGDVSSWCIDHATTKSVIEISQAFTGPLQQDLTAYKSIGMIGGGSGIAPLMSHLRTLRENDSHQSVYLLYSTRKNTQCYKNELQSTKKSEHIDTRLTDVVSRFTQDEIVTAMRDCDVVLVCGSRKFVTSIQEILHDSLPSLTVFGEAFSLQ